MDQYMEIISAPDAWQIADDDPNDEDEGIDKELKPTNSARRVKALVEQVTGIYVLCSPRISANVNSSRSCGFNRFAIEGFMTTVGKVGSFVASVVLLFGHSS